MLLNRSFHQLYRKIIPLFKSVTSLGTRLCRVPTETQLLSNDTSGIYSCRNRQRKVVITTLTLPVFFATVAQAQWRPPTLKAKESAAKQYVAAMNKAQQSYYANNTGFTSSVSNLGLGIKPDTANYKYSISTNHKVVFNYAVSNKANLKSLVGGVFLVGNKPQTILCLNAAPGKIKPPNPTNTKGVLKCAAGTGKIAQ
jgi:type II secretory pathway pseudopilin PulG